MVYDFGDLGAFSYDNSLAGHQAARAILRRLEPADVKGFRKVRLGRQGDGGYVMLDDFDGIRAAYSLGIDTDVSWDADMARRGIDIFQYDHTVAAPPEPNERFHFHRVGVSDRNRKHGPFKTLPTLLRENGHLDAGGDLILKCDIEGSEWAVLGTLAPDQLRLFRQIVVEVHGLRDLHKPDFVAFAGKVFESLTTDHRVVHVHGNNCAAYAIVGGMPVPTVLEITLVRKDNKTFTRSRQTFPTKLDQPNNPGAADYALGLFRF